VARARDPPGGSRLDPALRARGPAGELTAGEKTSKHGTIIRFKPDSKIFEETTFSFDTLSNRLRELAFLNRGLKITIEDERDDRKNVFFYTGGIIEFVKHMNQNKTPVHPKVLYFEASKGDTVVEVALHTTTVIRRPCSHSRTTSTRAKAART